MTTVTKCPVNTWMSSSRKTRFKNNMCSANTPYEMSPSQTGTGPLNRVRAKLSSPVPVWLGDISYGVFAMHMFFLNLVFRLLDIPVFTGHFVTVVLATLLLTLPVASASFYLFERRILRAKDARFVTRLDAGARPAGATVR